ncbi:uncharacterized protein LOC119091441 [Pollicipes pollicipes]|uniref:uncharacterized protein LOC119091441 n=1 Tax=Pollicipes pollicipes TaxID=41117 RepID=UPI001884E654|nr:uncharacterized protein LOC119091441 [Pollicipes pollicipes]
MIQAGPPVRNSRVRSRRGPRPKRRRTTSTRRKSPVAAPDPSAAQRIGPIVDVQIHKPSDGDEERPILVTRGRNVRRTTAGQKRAAPADSDQPGPSHKRPATAHGGDWSERENTYLLLSRVALGLLADTYKVPSRQYLTVRDALHETIEESRNKTAHAVHRRIAFMLRRRETAANVSLTIQEHAADPDIRRITGTPSQRLTQNTHNTEVVFPKRFREVMAVLLAKWDASSTKGSLLPEDYAKLSQQFDIVLGDNSFLASREDKTAPSLQLYHASQRYPEDLMFAALTHVRTMGVASQRRRTIGGRLMRDDKGLLHSTSRPYILSTKGRTSQIASLKRANSAAETGDRNRTSSGNRFIQRYQYGLYADCYNFFKTLLWNSLKERAVTAIGGVQRGGQAAMIFGLMATNKLLYDVAVPDNLIRLSTKEKEQGTALMQGMMEYRSDAAAADRGGMALGRSSGGTRRVGQRSMSRLVLLATRESQDTELLMAGGNRPGRKDTHNYHEQLHIVPFTVLARLVTPEESAAGGSADGEGPMEVDEQYMPVSPRLAQTARDKLARMLSEEAPGAAAVLERLRAEDAITDRDASHIKQLLSILEDAGELGMEPAQLLEESSLARLELRRLVALMVQHELLLRGGVTRLLYVARSLGQRWVLHSYHLTRLQQESAASGLAAVGGDLASSSRKDMQPVFFQTAPWRRVGGSVNRRVLDRLSGAVLSHCMTWPACPLAAVQSHFHPMLTAVQTRQLLETLEEVGCVTLTENRQVSRTTLFSKRSDLAWFEGPADDCSPPDSVLVMPAADAVLKFACFVGDKPYSQEFLDTVGL